MIGPSEREIRYENLVQRLLRRADHGNRRIVCLSAILPEGDQLNDLTAWIRNDAPGGPIQSNWRPTRQRFGTLTWLGASARLSFDLEADAPFIRHFIPQVPPISPRRTPFPRDNRELTLAAAWKFSGQGKRVLVFCTQRDHVEGFATAALDVQQRGYLPSLLENVQSVERAISVGREWLGADHPAVRCLAIGVGVHHGRLPGPFQREVELLLATGVLRVTIASPTLAQGLNLNAAVLLVPSLYRSGSLISGEEFANVSGRAGRAFVDVEGLVIHVIREPEAWRLGRWRELVNSARARNLSSGIFAVVEEVMRRLANTGVFGRADAMDYLANAQEAWFPPARDEGESADSIESLIERLDATVLGLVEALDTESTELPRLLDEALTGSLWAREIARLAPERKPHQLWILESRARLIWNKTTVAQRRGQFAMGVGLETGLAISAIAPELTTLLDSANTFALQGDAEGLAHALIQLAEQLLSIRPFIPEDRLPQNWRDLLRAWIRGDDVSTIGLDNMRVVEDAFVYRLVWSIEALRMNRRANGGESEVLEGTAAACLETGLPSSTMAMLVRAGLPSRVAAKLVIEQMNPMILTRRDMSNWLRSPEVAALDAQVDWPTAETGAVWRRFRAQVLEGDTRKWEYQEWNMPLAVGDSGLLANPGRIGIDAQSGQVSITTPDYRPVIDIRHRLNHRIPSLLHVEFSADGTNARIVRTGPDVAEWVEPT